MGAEVAHNRRVRRLKATSATLAWLLPTIAALLVADGASATFPGGNGSIVFARFGRIYMLQNGHQRQLTFGPAFDRTPAFSADGRSIVFKREPAQGAAHLSVMNADGSHARAIPHTDGHDFAPSFGPAGRTIVFQSDRDILDEIWTINVDGTHRHRRTHLDGWNGRPSFSPDGRHIVFVRQDGVYIIKRGGGDLHRLAKTDTDEGPSFSPNGKRIAFEKNSSVYTMRVDGRDKRRLTSGHFDDWPTYSPDGRRIVFYRYRPDPFVAVKPEGTFTIRVDGTNLQKISDVTGDRLDWQPLDDPA